MGVEVAALLEYSNDRALPDEVAPGISNEGRHGAVDGLVGGQVLVCKIVEVPDVESVGVLRPAPKLVPCDRKQGAADVACGTRDGQEVAEDRVKITLCVGVLGGIDPEQAGASSFDREEDGEDV